MNTTATCPCRACQSGRKVLSLTELAAHFGTSRDDLRATIKAGDGPPPFKPAHRRYARYYLPSAEAWMAGRNDRAGAA